MSRDKTYTRKDGKSVKPIGKDTKVTGLDLPDNVAPPVSDSTLDAVRKLIPNAPRKLPRKGWGSAR